MVYKYKERQEHHFPSSHLHNMQIGSKAFPPASWYIVASFSTEQVVIKDKIWDSMKFLQQKRQSHATPRDAPNTRLQFGHPISIREKNGTNMKSIKNKCLKDSLIKLIWSNTYVILTLITQNKFLKNIQWSQFVGLLSSIIQ